MKKVLRTELRPIKTKCDELAAAMGKLTEQNQQLLDMLQVGSMHSESQSEM